MKRADGGTALMLQRRARFSLRLLFHPRYRCTLFGSSRAAHSSMEAYWVASMPRSFSSRSMVSTLKLRMPLSSSCDVHTPSSARVGDRSDKRRMREAPEWAMETSGAPEDRGGRTLL